MVYELAATDLGPSTDLGSGTSIVLLHAFPCDRRMWDAQIRSLGESGFRVVAPDLPGFGESPLPTGTPSLSIAAQAVFDLMDDRAIGSVMLAGLSMGGYVAMEMLRQQPGRISALALVDTKASSDPEPAREQRRSVADAVLAADSSNALLGMLPKLLGETTRNNRPEVVREVEAFIAAASPEAVAWSQRAMADRPESLPALERFRGPSLVLYGQEDTLSPDSDQVEMANALPGAELQSIPASGHLSALEQPDEVSDALLRLARSLG